MTAHAELVDNWQPPPSESQGEGIGADLCRELDSASRCSIPLSVVWSDLVSGQWKVRDCFFASRRAFMTLTWATNARPDRRLALRKVHVLERILLGEGQKAVALALKVAPSTVTLMSGECLRAMGLTCRTSRVPMPLVMAAHAAKNCTSYRDGKLAEITLNGTRHRVIGVPLPDAGLSDLLSPAEREVTRLLIEGFTHVDIACARATSTRTIANQLAAAFHKLRVSGRAELLCRLIRSSGAESPSDALAPPRFTMWRRAGEADRAGARAPMAVAQRPAESA